MVSDTIYTLCLPLLEDSTLEEEDKTEKLEDLLSKEASLKGASLENAVLDVLWKFRDSANPLTSTPPSRHIIIRRTSPAPWQHVSQSSAPLPSSPVSIAPPPGLGMTPPAFGLSRSSAAASPFGSPRPSPRMAFAHPRVPHSPSLNNYEFVTDFTPSPDTFGDYGRDSVDMLVHDDANSAPSSVGTSNGFASMSSQGYSVPEMDMSPCDILRSVLGEERTDEEIEKALEEYGYDFNATLVALMQHSVETKPVETQNTILVGKSMHTTGPTGPRPVTPSAPSKNGIVCKFYLSTGSCLRADCRFSHDLTSTICKYWIMGNCLAGETCVFSHDPSTLVSRFHLDSSPSSTPPNPSYLNSSDYASFPALNPAAESWSITGSGSGSYKNSGYLRTLPQGYKQPYLYDPSSNKPHSRPSSRHQNRELLGPMPPVDDNEAFPSLGAGGIRGKKHHGKRGHGHAQKDYKDVPSSLADVMRMSPAKQSAQSVSDSLKSSTPSRSRNAAAASIPPPEHIPWLETGSRANKQYLHARQSAIKHGALRNKFLQSAQQAWARNDARAAKALSLRGQSENDLMRKAHREAARFLYEERNKHINSGEDAEIYVDLHGLHQEEAIAVLEDILLKHQNLVHEKNTVFAITGTGHHSKQGRDKIGKAIRSWLDEWRYAYREFSAPGDRNSVGGILGINAASWDRSLGERARISAKDSVEASSGIDSGEPKGVAV